MAEKALFSIGEEDNFRPNYGGVDFTPRLNNLLEEVDIELVPVNYHEGDKPKMQLTQENTFIFINQVADELDCISVSYDQDPSGIATWWFREKFTDPEASFEKMCGMIGVWATVVTTTYPMKAVVEQYERLHSIGDEMPDWLQ